MGVTFHYSGRFNPAASLSEMISEVEEIATTHKWNHLVYERSFPSGDFDQQPDHRLFGISFTPPQCETVHLVFLSDGRLSSFFNLKLYSDPVTPEFSEFLYMLSVKTQYAGAKIHIQLMKLFKYLGRKYLLDLEMHDEGHYWETEDETVVNAVFERHEVLIANFKLGLENIPKATDETVEAYVRRVAEYVQAKSAGKKKNNGEALN